MLALAHHDLHGYGLVQAISEHTDGLVVLDPGNLYYRVIRRLLADGLVTESDRKDVEGGRKYYRITPLGGRVLCGCGARQAYGLCRSAHRIAYRLIAGLRPRTHASAARLMDGPRLADACLGNRFLEEAICEGT